MSNLEFVQAEGRILEFWDAHNIFEKSLKLNRTKPRFNFYDGPPFATGLPHYGHLLAGTIKDVVCRFAHQTGHHVERRFGWDCHGLPVEYEIDQRLGIKGPEDVEKIGIAAYNAECRNIVMRYSSEWEKTVRRMGRWVDFQNDYKTMYPSFMESVWWVFKQLYERNLVYRGIKVMPYSTACATPLSNFESTLNYVEAQDPSVIVSFPVLVDGQPSNKHLLAWTTTPWTLPSNLALCCNPNLDYVEIEDTKKGAIFICLESRLEFVFKKNYQSTHKILRKFKGAELEGLNYEPLFSYFLHFKKSGAFRVVTDGYVSADTGTGIVHQAPYFGEDDNRVCLSYGIITKEGEIVCPIDAKGRFVAPVEDFLGQYIKEADKNIIRNLKQRDRLLSSATINHKYPVCWRSDTPLIYRAIPSWFIRVEQSRDRLLEHISNTYWVPDHVKEKRFTNWLKEARDWAVSRNRYWGTPIPIWTSEDGTEIVCVGSIDELAQLSGVRVKDLHRETVDSITIPSKQGKGALRRVPEVFDCWFESGSMPYAQRHYPFQDSEDFENCFPADFIAEGIDQTRGWFYTLLVISTLLFDKPPFKNLIVNGLVLAEDGKKMSKREKNYTDVTEVIDHCGADALRLYLITSPAVKAENLRFRLEGVQDILKEVLIPWHNAVNYFMSYGSEIEVVHKSSLQLENITDHWIVSSSQSLVKFIVDRMGEYHLYEVAPKFSKFVDNLTKWYIKMNRPRLIGERGEAEARTALSVLYHVLMTMSRIMAPFTPFITEFFYEKLRTVPTNENHAESVHHLSIPDVIEKQIDVVIERKIHNMQRVVELARVIRDRRNLSLKCPLAKVIVISREQFVSEDVKELADYIKLELNVLEVETTDNKERFGVKIGAQPDTRLLFSRLRAEAKGVIEAIKRMSELQLREYQSDPENYLVAGKKLEEGELKEVFALDSGDDGKTEKGFEAHSDGKVIVLLHVEPDQSMIDTGLAREFAHRIQNLRKEAGLVKTDPADVEYYLSSNDKNECDYIQRVVDEFRDYICTKIKGTVTRLDDPLTETKREREIKRVEGFPLKKANLQMVLVRRL